MPPALAGHQLEQRLRAVVLGGLWALFEVVVRGDARALRCSRCDAAGLVLLGLAAFDLEAWLEDGSESVPGRVIAATPLGAEVLQQLAVMRVAGGFCPEPAQTGAWRDVLIAAGQLTERGRRLLEWLRLGTLNVRCSRCDEPATGLGRFRSWTPNVPACNAHRVVQLVSPEALGALDRHLAEVSSCPTLEGGGDHG